MTDKELMQQAMEALEACAFANMFGKPKPYLFALTEAAMNLRERLAQPEQEPVAWGYRDRHGNIIDVITPAEHDRAEGDYKVPLYTAPQQSEWVGLTAREFQDATDGLEDLEDCWKAIEAKLEEKNT